MLSQYKPNIKRVPRGEIDSFSQNNKTKQIKDEKNHINYSKYIQVYIKNFYFIL